MKITDKGIQFIEDLTEAIEKNASIIGEEFKKITGLSGTIEIKNIESSGADVYIYRPACGRGCCSAENIGHVSITTRDIKYPSLKINSMREKAKSGKIENSYVSSMYRNKDRATGNFYKK